MRKLEQQREIILIIKEKRNYIFRGSHVCAAKEIPEDSTRNVFTLADRVQFITELQLLLFSTTEQVLFFPNVLKKDFKVYQCSLVPCLTDTLNQS